MKYTLRIYNGGNFLFENKTLESKEDVEFAVEKMMPMLLNKGNSTSVIKIRIDEPKPPAIPKPVDKRKLKLNMSLLFVRRLKKYIAQELDKNYEYIKKRESELLVDKVMDLQCVRRDGRIDALSLIDHKIDKLVERIKRYPPQIDDEEESEFDDSFTEEDDFGQD